MAGLIEFSNDVIWYSAGGPYVEVLGAARAYLDEDTEPLDVAIDTRGLFISDFAEPRPLLRALDHALVRLMAELINAANDAGQLDHYAELRTMVRRELALTPEPPP